MSKTPLSAERVAAFLDGRLSAEERTDVLAQLATDPDWREIAADAAAARADVQGTVGDEVAPRRAVGTRWGPWIALAAAAVVTVVVLGRRDSATVVNGRSVPIAPVQALALGVSPDGARALASERWRVVRAGTNEIDDLARAVRLGALSVDALLDRDGQGSEARAEMVELLEPLNGAVARRMLADARDSASVVMALSAARALVLNDAYDVGVWLQLLRAGSESARTATGMTALLRGVVEAKQLSPERAAELAALVRRVESLAPSQSQQTVRDLATTVLALLAS